MKRQSHQAEDAAGEVAVYAGRDKGKSKKGREELTLNLSSFCLN